MTLGLVHDTFKVEASRFHGREPDQHRYNIEPGALDSTAARFSWNPAATLALQISWARQISPEQLAPHEDDTRASVSAIYTMPLEGERFWSTTVAYGYRRSSGGPPLRAYLLESAVRPGELWTLFGRLERSPGRGAPLAADAPGPRKGRHDGRGCMRGFRGRDRCATAAGLLVIW